MAIISTQDVKDYLVKIQGRDTTLEKLRKEFNIKPGDKSFDAIRNILFQIAEQGIIRPSGMRDGCYHVIKQVHAVHVFGDTRVNKDPFELRYPRDYLTGEFFSFESEVIIRSGDLILIAGLSNFGKTALCLNFCAENIDLNPVLMGNEYTTEIDGEFAPTPRFKNRLESFEGVQWADEKGRDKFTLLPVRDDYDAHIIKDRINIIDWINIATGEHYMIGTILEGIKRRLGKGIGIVAIQKGEGADAGRGGQFTKDFADFELLIDRLNDNETLMTIGKVKESRSRVSGRSWAFSIHKGILLSDIREVMKCPECHGKGWKKQGLANVPCNRCQKSGWLTSK